MSRFNRFALALLGLATVALYGGRAVLALRGPVDHRPFAVAVDPTPPTQPVPTANRSRPVLADASELKRPETRFRKAILAEAALAASGGAFLLASADADAAPKLLLPTVPVESGAAESGPSARPALPEPAAVETTPETQASGPPDDGDAPPAWLAAEESEPQPADVADQAVPDEAVEPEPDDPVITTSARSMDELARKFRNAGYRFEDIVAGTRTVPRIILRRFPPDVRDQEAAEDRKLMFLQALLPIVLYKNQEIRRDRERLLGLRDIAAEGELTERDRDWLLRLCTRYRVEPGDMDELVERVDVIPPSLALAQAATESGWGTSRPAREDNALFGQYADNGEAYVIRSFDALLKSAQSYALNLNTHRAYRALRAKRAQMRDAGKPLDGYALATTLENYSELGTKYVRYVRRMIKENRLAALDQARLAGDALALASE